MYEHSTWKLTDVKYPDLGLYDKEIEEKRNEALALRQEIELLRKFNQAEEVGEKRETLTVILEEFRYSLSARHRLQREWILEMEKVLGGQDA